MSDNLVTRVDDYTRKHFKVSVKDFIEQGLKKGRHYFYLRDALDLNDKDFKTLLCKLNFNLKAVLVTKEQYRQLFYEYNDPDEAEDNKEFLKEHKLYLQTYEGGYYD